MAEQNNILEAEVYMRHDSKDGSVNEATGAHLSAAAEENTPLLESSDARQQSSRYVGYKSTYLINWFSAILSNIAIKDLVFYVEFVSSD